MTATSTAATNPAAMRAVAARPRGLDAVIDAAFAVACATLALLGFGTIFGGLGYLWLGLAGVAIAVAVSALTARLPILVVAGLAVLIYLWVGVVALFGADAVFGALPGPAGLAAMSRASVHGWREVVTTLPPVAGRDLLAVPYLTGFAGVLAGVQLAWRTRAVMAPLAGPAAMLAAVILLGTAEPAPLIACGVAFAAVGIGWAAARQRRFSAAGAADPAGALDAATGHRDAGAAGGRRRGRGGFGRAARAITMIAVAALGAALASLTPLGAHSGRFVLRDHVRPPFDVDAYPSPLSTYRRFEVTDKDKVLFTVSGLPAGARVRLAVLDRYDGVVWGVAGGAGSTQASGVFQRVGDPIAAPAPGAAATVTVTLGALGGVWLPTVGELRSIRFAGPRAAGLASSFRYNLRTGVGVAPVALGPSDRYTMSVVVPPTPDAAKLSGNAAGADTLPETTNVPDSVAVKAQAWTEGLAAPVPRLLALVAQLRNGAFSDGTVTSGVVSPPGAGAHRIATFLAAPQLVGDGEQYAATLALMARSLGVPARVVVGVPPRPAGFDGKVTGKMISAWVEVDIAGAGWTPLDPTPPVDNHPRPQQNEPQPNSLTKVIAPPVVEAPATAEESGDDPGLNPPPPPGSPNWWRLPLRIGEYGGFEVLGLAALLGAVALAKRRRARRRRSTGPPLDRIAAAWTELTERLRDLGIATPARATRRQRATAAGFPQVAWVADRIDRAVFAPGDPDADEAAEVWKDVDELLARLSPTRTRLRRLRAACDPTSLRPPQPGWLRLPTRAEIAARIPKPPLRLSGLGERS